MPGNAHRGRSDTASRVIGASSEAIYQVFADPVALMKWLPPTGMTGQALEYDVRDGGRYRIELRYEDGRPGGSGKTTDRTDVTKGQFVELVPDRRITQSVEFESSDPASRRAASTRWWRRRRRRPWRPICSS